MPLAPGNSGPMQRSQTPLTTPLAPASTPQMGDRSRLERTTHAVSRPEPRPMESSSGGDVSGEVADEAAAGADAHGDEFAGGG